ncbi:hypothetical protein DTW91_10905 [Chryseobacterium sp. SC28]|nr:hypothetical protein DTW91_10905 [Chryseobacterium sp. SC28]
MSHFFSSFFGFSSTLVAHFFESASKKVPFFRTRVEELSNSSERKGFFLMCLIAENWNVGNEDFQCFFSLFFRVLFELSFTLLRKRFEKSTVFPNKSRTLLEHFCKKSLFLVFLIAGKWNVAKEDFQRFFSAPFSGFLRAEQIEV